MRKVFINFINNHEVDYNQGKLAIRQKKTDIDGLSIKDQDKKSSKLPEYEGNKKYYEIVEKELRKLLDDTNTSKGYNKLDLMIRDSVLYRVGFDFEQTYRIIYKSQYELLQILYERGIDETEARKIFDDAKNRLPKRKNNYEFSTWLNFLINYKLISESKRKVKITDKGRAFLDFVRRQNYLEPAYF